MYQALRRRDSTYDGVFYVAVRSTGVFCRPICPARKPHARNVEFFATASAVLAAGYRPCKRCRPLELHGRPPAWVDRLLGDIARCPDGRFTDEDLRARSVEPARARRYFKENYGMTFHAYHRAQRMGMALADLRRGDDLSEVGLRHGFDSDSGFRDAFSRTFGRPPGRARNMPCLFAHWLDTPLSGMLAVAGDDGLCMLEFLDRRGLQNELARLRRRSGAAIVPGDNSHLAQIADELARYFDGTLTSFSVPVVLHGTPFQREVWSQLREIPHGQTSSYARLAAAIGRPGAQRAVGRANGENCLAIIVPCHRVVRSDGTLCGYGGGLWRKKWLLEHERRAGGAANPPSNGS